MTEKLYYESPYISEFNAKVLFCEEKNGRFLTVLDKRSKSLAETVYQLADRKSETLSHISIGSVAVGIINKSVPVGLNTSKVIKTLGDYFIATLVNKVEWILTDFEGKRSAGKYEFVFFVLNLKAGLAGKIQFKVGPVMGYAKVVLGLHSDNFGCG